MYELYVKSTGSIKASLPPSCHKKQVQQPSDRDTLTVGPRDPQLLEDLVMRERIFRFDHERIPERVVHARGYGAKGYFIAEEGPADWRLCVGMISTARKDVPVLATSTLDCADRADSNCFCSGRSPKPDEQSDTAPSLFYAVTNSPWAFVFIDFVIPR